MDTTKPATIHIGNTVWYKLLPHDKPVNAHRLWRGKVLGRMGAMLRVEILDDGYQGLTEAIWTEQVIATRSASME